MSMEKVRWVWE